MKARYTKNSKLVFFEKESVKHGLRLTRLRKIILGILFRTKQHLNIAQIHHLACGKKYDFAVASVYRNINALVAIGVVEAHQFKKGYATYELAGTNPHDHLIDLDSGRIIEFQNTALDQLKVKIAKQHGYRADACHIEFYAYPIKTRSKSNLRNEA